MSPPATSVKRRVATEKQRLVAAKGTEPGRLAGAIASQIRGLGAASVVAMGPAAAYVALKSAIIAGEFLKGEKPGQEVAFALKREDVSGDSDDIELQFCIALLPSPSEVPSGDKKILVSKTTNVGKLGSYMAKVYEEEAFVPPLHGRGEVAVSQALKATMIANTYVTQGPKALAEGEELVLAPQMVRTIKVDGNRTMEIVLRWRLAATFGLPDPGNGEQISAKL